eukprot:TRINITY_DN1294_c0_g1_i11.p1 TRINITY_DN1294_c0_g1~~TRINITY_DN1294_c0_g1_i11.p1  ORF type:complete len:202 (+),score=28.86 TRINITY_DN1294_c0_g1_i11:387-992(+)
MCSFPPVLDIQVMNAIFSAQKREIPVHACVLGGKDSVFMQQAAHLTNGMYSRPEEQQHLSQFLLVCFYIHTSRVSVHILSSLFDFTSLQSPTPTSFSLSPLSLSPSPSLSLSLSLPLALYRSQGLYCIEPNTRALMQLPKQESIDLRATCFCHKKPVDSGYVCSVCLSIFCDKRPECSTCGAEFPQKRATGKRLAAATAPA